jgi:hypothetical protein
MKKSLIVIGIITLFISNIFANNLQKQIIGEWEYSYKSTNNDGVTIVKEVNIEYCQDNTSNALVKFKVLTLNKNNKPEIAVSHYGVILSKWNIKNNILTEQNIRTRVVKDKMFKDLPKFLKFAKSVEIPVLKSKSKIISINNQEMILDENNGKHTYTRIKRNKPCNSVTKPYIGYDKL